MRARRAPALASAGLVGLLFVLASACGGGGSSVPACRVDATAEPPAPNPEASLTLATGSYEGTGSRQCITGVGFQPVLVIVKGDTREFTVWRSSSMQGDSTADFSKGQPNFEDGITSLDPDAFSLGKDVSVNAEGITYHYTAFADSPEIKVGSYIGDGVAGLNVDDVGFEPALLFVKWDGLRTAVWRAMTHPEGESSFFHGEGDLPGFITAFDKDGFRVSGDPWVNADGSTDDEASTYHYVAFREAAGRFKTGSYLGDGSDSRDITDVGFQPDYVWIKRAVPGSGAVLRSSSLSGDATLEFGNLPVITGEITALLSDGFQVGSESAVNAKGDTYNYVAWKSSGP